MVTIGGFQGKREPWVHEEHIEFDRSGNATQSVIIMGPQSTTIRSSRTFQWSFVDGHLMEKTFEQGDGDKMPYLANVRIYDAAGRVIEDRKYDESGGTHFTLVYSYDDSGRLTVMESHSADERVIKKSRWSYDAQGRWVASTHYDCESDGQCRVVDKLHTKYETHDRPSEIWHVREDGTLAERHRSVYNERGDVEEEAVYAEGGSLRQKGRSVYTYDAVGNWIQRATTTFVRDGHPVEEPPDVMTRTITYYPE